MYLLIGFIWLRVVGTGELLQVYVMVMYMYIYT
jgi:hypothetical protein